MPERLCGGDFFWECGCLRGGALLLFMHWAPDVDGRGGVLVPLLCLASGFCATLTGSPKDALREA
jgi:hypothetical protein